MTTNTTNTLGRLRDLAYSNLWTDAVALVASLQGPVRVEAAHYLRELAPDLAISPISADSAVLMRVRAPAAPGDLLRWWPVGGCGPVDFLTAATHPLAGSAPADVLRGDPLGPILIGGRRRLYTDVHPEHLRTMLKHLEARQSVATLDALWRAAVIRMALQAAPSGETTCVVKPDLTYDCTIYSSTAISVQVGSLQAHFYTDVPIHEALSQANEALSQAIRDAYPANHHPPLPLTGEDAIYFDAPAPLEEPT